MDVIEASTTAYPATTSPDQSPKDTLAMTVSAKVIATMVVPALMAPCVGLNTELGDCDRMAAGTGGMVHELVDLGETENVTQEELEEGSTASVQQAIPHNLTSLISVTSKHQARN